MTKQSDMYKKKKYKVVCVTPAGRRRYMRYLVPQIIVSPLVDRYDIWVNTTDRGDITFLNELQKKYPKIRLLQQPEGKIDSFYSIRTFFRYAIESDSIYIRLDDDIVWIEPNFFEEMIHFRLSHPEFFWVSPLVINNAICTHLLQRQNLFQYPKYITANCYDELGWKNGKFAEDLHRWFMDKIIDRTYKKLHSEGNPIALNRFSINSICWFGKTFRSFKGFVTSNDEEEFMTVIKPTEMGLLNYIYCNTIVAHLAFFPQRDFIDKTDILDRYSKVIQLTYRNRPFAKIHDEIQSIYQAIDDKHKTETEKGTFSAFVKKALNKI